MCSVVHTSCFFCVKQKTAYEWRISDWSSDVCSSDLGGGMMPVLPAAPAAGAALAASAWLSCEGGEHAASKAAVRVVQIRRAGRLFGFMVRVLVWGSFRLNAPPRQTGLKSAGGFARKRIQIGRAHV